MVFEPNYFPPPVENVQWSRLGVAGLTVLRPHAVSRIRHGHIPTSGWCERTRVLVTTRYGISLQRKQISVLVFREHHQHYRRLAWRYHPTRSRDTGYIVCNRADSSRSSELRILHSTAHTTCRTQYESNVFYCLQVPFQWVSKSGSCHLSWRIIIQLV